ncbi:MAG: Sec-independent protein translocase subunit TatA [Actinomycetota bacterium]|nr:Sec-independent protein translocase subunit TatA [Actinomycetota bacterium]
MFSGADAPWHWFILVIVVVALFGYKRLPDAARSLGRSMRIFKTEIKGMTEDDAARAATKAEIVAPVQPTGVPSAPPPATEAVQPSAPAQSPANTAAVVPVEVPTTSGPAPTSEPGRHTGV